LEEWILDGGQARIDTNKAIELYHLENDMGETNNLVHSHPDIRDALIDDLILWQETVGAPVYEMTKNPQYVSPVRTR
ncbi:MAG: hypothetical protein MI922_04205, partial [Bacteroidales bacterium]|nr:hypothetical protein [Bacteroidales bacterium]